MFFFLFVCCVLRLSENTQRYTGSLLRTCSCFSCMMRCRTVVLLEILCPVRICTKYTRHHVPHPHEITTTAGILIMSYQDATTLRRKWTRKLWYGEDRTWCACLKTTLSVSLIKQSTGATSQGVERWRLIFPRRTSRFSELSACLV